VSIMLLANVRPHVRLVNVSHCGLIWYLTWHMCSCYGANRNMRPVGNETCETMMRVIGASWSRVGGISGLLDFRRHDRVGPKLSDNVDAQESSCLVVRDDGVGCTVWMHM
jgi:hypothetical protein